MRCMSDPPPTVMLLAEASAGVWSAPHVRTGRCLLRGEESDRSRGSLAVHCCPPRPSGASPRRGPRGPSTGPRTRTIVRARATLLTLAPTFPTRSGPCDPAARRVSSRGVVQRSPLHRPSRRVRVPEIRARSWPFGSWHRPALVRDGNAGSHPRAVLVVSHHLDGLFLFDPAAVAGRCRSWGSSRFLLSRNRIPRDAPAALRSFPSADSDGRRNESGPPWARVTAPTVSDRRVHRGPCPRALRTAVSGGPGLEALLHRRVRCAGGRCRPPAPGAPLGLSGPPPHPTFQRSSRSAGQPCERTSRRYVKDHSEEWLVGLTPGRRSRVAPSPNG